jgi:hypothetical protein
MMKGGTASVEAIFIECSTALSLENINKVAPRMNPTIAMNASTVNHNTNRS